MELFSRLDEIIETLHLENPDEERYVLTLLEDLKFKGKAIEYHHERTLQAYANLMSEAERELDASVQIKVKDLRAQLEELSQNIHKYVDPAQEPFGPKFELSTEAPLDAEEVFFEFEALLSSLTSFFYIALRIFKVKYAQMATSKTNCLNSLDKQYDRPPLYYIIERASDWLEIAFSFRDHLVHISSLNQKLRPRITYHSEHRTIETTQNSVKVSIQGDYTDYEIPPLYVPSKPMLRHILEDMIYDDPDDLIPLDEYLTDLKVRWMAFTSELCNELQIQLSAS